MTNEFTVIGEHREDDTQLLVRGADGQYYGYVIRHERLSRVHPDEQWVYYDDTDDVDTEFGASPVPGG
jgi:hypothetical protein